MGKNKNVRLRSDLRFQPLFSGFSMQIDHLHPIFSAPRLFRKDLPYIASNITNFNLWYSTQSHEFKIAFEKLKAFSVDWSRFLVDLANQSGYSLDSVYDKIPKEVKGGLELFYTGLNKPSYKSNAIVYEHDVSKELHSFILTNAKTNQNWKYWWGGHATELQIQKPIDHISSTTLADLLLNPSNFDVVYEKVSSEVDRDTLELITDNYVDETGMTDSGGNQTFEVSYINHATLLVKKDGFSVMIDPLLNFYDLENQVSMYDFAPSKIDYVVITHAHYDHIDLSTLITLRNRIGKILLPRASEVESDFSLKRALEPYFPGKVFEMAAFEEVEVANEFTVTSLPFQGEHADLISPKSTWLASVSGKNYWFGADSRAIDVNLYKFIREKYGTFEAIFVGTVCQGSPLSRAYPHFSHSTSRVNSNSRTTKGADHEEIFEMITALNPKSVYIYALGYEKWLRNFLGKPIQRYSDEYVLLQEKLSKNNVRLKNIGFLVNPRKVSE
jgi:hypothetical protein